MSRSPVRSGAYRAFSLIELVIVVAIFATVAAIAIPKMSRGAEGAAASALMADLAALNKALDLYAADHLGSFPTKGEVHKQLTMYSDVTGTKFSDTADHAGGIAYGPYLRAVPPVPIGPNRGNSTISASNGSDVGWLYSASKRLIMPNLLDEGGGVANDLPEVYDDIVIQVDDLAKAPDFNAGGGAAPATPPK